VTRNDGLLGRAELERAFTALGDRLKRRGVVADLFIVGGAAMALAYDAIRVTRDVDALFVPHARSRQGHGLFVEPPGREIDASSRTISVYISGQDDPGKKQVFDHPGLRVMAASPEHIFAMKAIAARTRDVDDLRHLATLTGIATTTEALALCAQFFPDEEISPRANAVLSDLFEQS
jgi:hypothetical protein